eukprot:1867853-Rhodomonas_salina.1
MAEGKRIPDTARAPGTSQKFVAKRFRGGEAGQEPRGCVPECCRRRASEKFRGASEKFRWGPQKLQQRLSKVAAPARFAGARKKFIGARETFRGGARGSGEAG